MQVLVPDAIRYVSQNGIKSGSGSAGARFWEPLGLRYECSCPWQPVACSQESTKGIPMVKSIFASFHYDNDNSRVQQVLKMGAIEEASKVTAQDWETVKYKTDSAIENWIHSQMLRKSAVVVLVGAETAQRKWVKYEIRKAWDDRRPLVGIRIHGLKNLNGYAASAGANPFATISTKAGDTLDNWLTLYSPSGSDSKAVYASISSNLESWINSAYARP